ncbi:hypothetical protein QVD17_02015 [Tagetes erecta]|uniref:Uncharacterized protein n=1 Tax=Tagetes erecta TaxID=13708 RepID=A0AAD8LBM8_TARER|nr:hypothetical protein QVD17_02015 [Tagetes erecta]
MLISSDSLILVVAVERASKVMQVGFSIDVRLLVFNNLQEGAGKDHSFMYEVIIFDDGSKYWTKSVAFDFVRRKLTFVYTNVGTFHQVTYNFKVCYIRNLKVYVLAGLIKSQKRSDIGSCT